VEERPVTAVKERRFSAAVAAGEEDVQSDEFPDWKRWRGY